MPTGRGFVVYVENKPGVQPVYRIDEGAVRRALGARFAQADVVVRQSDEPDLEILAEAEYFVGSGFDTGRLARHGTALRVVHCTSAGVERYMPLDWLREGAVLTNSSGVHAEKGGTFGAMAILMLNEGVPRHAANQRERRWQPTMSTVIDQKTVLVYGLGSLGLAVAVRIKRFGVRVIGIRRSGQAVEGVDEVHGPESLHSLLPEADFLVLTCPLTDLTRGVIGERELALLPPHAGVLNLARAAVLDNQALASALAENRLSGAILDVFDPEPLPADSPWWDVHGLMVTPHVSSDDAVGYVDRCLAVFARNLHLEADGLPRINVVDARLGY